MVVMGAKVTEGKATAMVLFSRPFNVCRHKYTYGDIYGDTVSISARCPAVCRFGGGHGWVASFRVRGIRPPPRAHICPGGCILKHTEKWPFLCVIVHPSPAFNLHCPPSCHVNESQASFAKHSVQQASTDGTLSVTLTVLQEPSYAVLLCTLAGQVRGCPGCGCPRIKSSNVALALVANTTAAH